MATIFTPRMLEIALFGTSSLPLCLEKGVTRIELNAAGSYAQSGLTPTEGEVREAVNMLTSHAGKYWYTEKFVFRVMIRPHDRDFFYTKEEIETMKDSMRKLGRLLRPGTGDGFVFGCLKKRRGRAPPAVDQDACRELVGLAKELGFRCVFHRACDLIMRKWQKDAGEVLCDLNDCGFNGVLTAGGPDGTAADQVLYLMHIVRAEERHELEIVVGGGVRSGNLESLMAYLGSSWNFCFHSAALKGNGGEDVDGEAVERMLGMLEAGVELVTHDENGNAWDFNKRLEEMAELGVEVSAQLQTEWQSTVTHGHDEGGSYT